MKSSRLIKHPSLAAALSIVLLSSQGLTLAQKAGNTSTVGKKKFELTIDNIMRGNALVGYEPRAIRWSGDSQRIYFQWKQASEPSEQDFDTYVVNRDATGLKKLTEEEAKSAPPVFGERSKDKLLILFVDQGDVYLYDNRTGQRRQMTSTTDIELNPHFTRDQKHVYYTRANNLYVMALDNGQLVQMTDIRTGGAPPIPVPNAGRGGFGRGGATQATQESGQQKKGTESQEYVKREEVDLFDVVKRRAQKREEDEAKRKREHPRKPFNLSGRQVITNLQLSPDEKEVIATVNEPGDGAKNTIVANYVTESAYTEEIGSRTKVGDPQSRNRLAVINVETGDVKWVDHGQRLANASGEPKEERPSVEPPSSQPDRDPSEHPVQTQGSREGRNGSSRPPRERDRDVNLSTPIWSEDGAKAVLMARAADNKDRWVLALDPATGKTRAVDHEHDDAWIDGPGAFTLGWLPDSKRIFFQSERTGFAHLYTIDYQGGEPKQLTSGKWEVSGVRLSDDKTRFFITTSEVHPGERQFYSMPVEGGERTRITGMTGGNQAFPSPDEKSLALIHSYSNKPPELYIQENKPGAAAVKVTSSPAPEFWGYNWIDPPIVTFRARDGAEVYARMYRPANFKKGGPGVIFVHGAGYAQNVHRYWSSYFREYMFHHLLMENGYLVMDVDYRASSGYGRDWRTAIYRHMGGKDLDDQVDAAAWMVREQGVDARRIGIYGGSYGGFITLMAMFTQPDVFAAGAALRPVTDWAHYNHPYTSNILNVPQKDAEAYKQSSPIYFADGLKGALLICHGMVDTNVHFQDTVRLIERLIELRKENWEVAVYPVENHGFVEATSWADEYKRIFKLFQDHLQSVSKSTVRK
jgi:dipeptidyl aminopeptidase/acylaminoacyl peptidase